MNKILSNPYRVLGLISPVSNKELEKRKNDLSTFIEFGKVPSYPLDFISSDLPVNRDVTGIEDAARHLEGDNDRLLYAIFWFYRYDAVDEFALEAIEEKDYLKAQKIWDEQIRKSVEPKFSWLINSSILSFLSESAPSMSYDELQRMINQYASVVTHIDKIKADVLKASKNTVDSIKVIEGIIDSFIEYASNSPYSSSINHNLPLLKAFYNYPENAKDYAESKILLPCLNLIEDIIKDVEQSLEDDYEYRFYEEVEKFKKHEGLIYELDLYVDNYKVKRLVNDYAETAKRCSIFAYNELDNLEIATELIEWADELPAYGETKDNITKNKATLEDNVRDKEKFDSYEPLLECLQTDIHSTEDAKRLQQSYYDTYIALPYDTRNYDETLINLTSAFVVKITNFCIELYKKSMEGFTSNKDLSALSNELQKCINIVDRLQSYVVDEDTEDALTGFQNHLESEKADVDDIRNNKHKSSNSDTNQESESSLLGTIIGWIIMIAIVSLLLDSC